MDQILLWQLRPRIIHWGADQRRHTVTLSAWHWSIFDALRQERNLHYDELTGEIARALPGLSIPEMALCRYLEQEATRRGQHRYGVANDTPIADPGQPQLRVATKARRSTLPLPTVRWPPFKPIARAKHLFA